MFRKNSTSLLIVDKTAVLEANAIQFLLQASSGMKFLISVVAVLTALSFAKANTLICGDSSSSKKVSIVTPFAPPNICEYTILAQSKSICQMRIDFSMSLAQPELPSAKNNLVVPECTQEYLSIGDFELCGFENEQHIYVPINRTAGIDSIKIVFKVAQRKGTSKLPPLSWDLKVTQLDCPAGIDLRRAEPEMRCCSAKDGYLLAPAGCDQYYPDDSGTIQSFNYNKGNGIYPYNLNYVMCFRRTTATVGLLIDAENFNLGGKSNETTIISQTDSHCYPQLPSEGSVEDYLMIPQAQVQDNDEVRANYFCGESLNGLKVLSTNPGPMSIVFNSGKDFKFGTKSLGFSLNYEIVY